MKKEVKKVVQQVSIDWCEDVLTKSLPWDADQFVTVKRFTQRDKRRRQSLAGTFKMGPAGREDVEVTIAIDRLKDFEWQHAITNFRFVDSKGKVLVFGAADQNQKIYDNASDDLAKFIDDMIAEVNKENKPEEVEKIEGNSEGSLD